MERRDVLAGLGVLVAAGLTDALAADQHAEHQHHHHAEHGGKINQALLDTTARCINTGEVCLAHCLQLLGEGDRGMAECARSVNQMLAVCRALNSLAAQGSDMVQDMAMIATDACHICYEACEKHAGKHPQCKACMDACEACERECKKAAG